MAGLIQKLSDELANQIAAGEVVERPSSVVKELVENAIDAGATRVVVDIEQGGTMLVRVRDDGDGMTEADAVLCLERHATSKIRRFSDLSELGTFGFRGEALPSIASVSRLVVRTRARDAVEGVQVVAHGGRAPSVEPCGGAVGTTIEVRDLFFNVPARRKFLKATGTESAHVSDVIVGMALARHDVTFVLTRDGRPVREHLRVGSRAERARSVLNGERLVECRAQRGPMQIEALLAPPERARAGATGLSILVNGRPVRDRQLARAVTQAYGSVLEAGRYPIGVVWIDVPPAVVDVNVHPQKAEVRFSDARGIFDAVTRELHDALAHAFGLPALGAHAQAPAMRFSKSSFAPSSFTPWPVRGGNPNAATSAAAAPRPPARLLDDQNLFAGPRAVGAASSSSSGSSGSSGSSAPSGSSGLAPSTTTSASAGTSTGIEANGERSGTNAVLERPDHASEYVALRPAPDDARAEALFSARTGYQALRYVGQVRGMFLVCEGDDGLYVLDQHAAAERVTFDRLRRAYASRGVPMQRLLVPEVVEIGPSDVALLEENAEQVSRLGIEVRAVGDAAVAVHGVPQMLVRVEPARLVADLVAELSRSAGRPFQGAVDLVLATMACHGSVRAGDVVSAAEVEALLRALDEADFGGHCPHGRPLVMRLPFGELERKVGR